MLTLWDANTANTKITRLLPKGAVTQFQITGYNRISYHVLKSTSLVVVSSRTEDYDARPVPPGSLDIVGFRSANMYVTAAWDKTSIDAYYFKDTNEKNRRVYGGMSKDNDEEFTRGWRWSSRSSSQFQCRSAVYLKGTDLIGAAQFADYDGLEATPFVSLSLLSTEWVLPMEAEYVGFLAVRPDSDTGHVDLKVYTPDGLLKGKFEPTTYN